MLGHYELRGELGRGAMAVVWRAWDTKLEREVAIKEPVIAPGIDPATVSELAERFVREGKAAAQLNHPGIVTIYAADVYDGRPAIVMELIEGETLTDVLRHGRLDATSAAGILDQLLDAAGYAHSRGIVHRDIKPDNVFLTRDGRVKLADFGIAHVGTTATLTQAGSVMGTPGYMAPEQVTGDRVDARTDIFAMGVIGYELFAGRNPFGVGDHGTQPTTIMYRIVHEQPAPIPDVAFTGQQFDLRPAIQAAMAKDPSARFPDAGSFRAALRGGALPAGHPFAPYPGVAGNAGVASAATVIVDPHGTFPGAKARPNWLPYAAIGAVGLIAVIVIAMVASGGVSAKKQVAGGGSAVATAAPQASAGASDFEVTLKVPTSVSLGEQVTIEAQIDNPSAVSVVKFYNNGAFMGQATSAPFTYTFSAAQAGQYNFQARATGVQSGVEKSTSTMGVAVAAPQPTPTAGTGSAQSGGDLASGVDVLLSEWAATKVNNDESGHIALYASTVSPFFGKSSASRDQVWDTYHAFFSKGYSNPQFWYSTPDIRVTGADSATATFTKYWDFGKGQKSERWKMWFRDDGSGLKIVGEANP